MSPESLQGKEMMHEHHEHDLRYCKDCDVVWCKGCDKEWGKCTRHWDETFSIPCDTTTVTDPNITSDTAPNSIQFSYTCDHDCIHSDAGHH